MTEYGGQFGGALALSLLLGAACGGAPAQGVAEARAAEPEVGAWVDQLGSILVPARECVQSHPGARATILAVRTLGTGETSILTRSRKEGAFACVHDGRAVVYQAKVAIPGDELDRLPFVMLDGGARPPGDECLEVRQLHWGATFVGWVAEPTCSQEEVNRASN